MSAISDALKVAERNLQQVVSDLEHLLALTRDRSPYSNGLPLVEWNQDRFRSLSATLDSLRQRLLFCPPDCPHTDHVLRLLETAGVAIPIVDFGWGEAATPAHAIRNASIEAHSVFRGLAGASVLLMDTPYAWDCWNSGRRILIEKGPLDFRAMEARLARQFIVARSAAEDESLGKMFVDRLKPRPLSTEHGGDLPAVRKLLTGWHEITEAVELRHDDRSKVKSLNERFDGPINTTGVKGAQPMVYRDELIHWWNHLAVKQQELANRQRGAELSASGHHYGMDGEVTPEFGGGVKKRRRDRKT